MRFGGTSKGQREQQRLIQKIVFHFLRVLFQLISHFVGYGWLSFDSYIESLSSLFLELHLWTGRLFTIASKL